jgi:hypothetical protein
MSIVNFPTNYEHRRVWQEIADKIGKKNNLSPEQIDRMLTITATAALEQDMNWEETIKVLSSALDFIKIVQKAQQIADARHNE